jgi:hypothetical protein
MKKLLATLLTVSALMTALAMTAQAQYVPGGHNETSEANAGLWASGAPTPGVAPALTANHLLLSEFICQPTPPEMVEIHNPTGAAVDLTNYYLTDAWFSPSAGVFVSYHLLPTGTYQITTNTDFCVRFPAGASIPAGGTIVVALYGPGVDSTFGAGTADFEVTSVSAGIPDMINVGNNNPLIAAGSTTLTNGSELIMLFYWDGVSDNVCDVDYVTWGSSSGTSRVDKTGLAVDGPDADAIATAYFADTPIASQSAVTSPGSGSSSARTAGAEGAEGTGGNGCVAGGPTPTRNATWGQVKVLYR